MTPIKARKEIALSFRAFFLKHIFFSNQSLDKYYNYQSRHYKHEIVFKAFG